jgi:hypothetical protein
VRASTGATTDVATASVASLHAGSIATFIAFGGATNDSTRPAGLLVCTDNQASGGPFSDCSVAQ